MAKNSVLIAAGAIFLSILLQMLLALPFMWLWDAVMPDLLGLKAITWVQAWCLMIMANILFKTNISMKSD